MFGRRSSHPPGKEVNSKNVNGGDEGGEASGDDINGVSCGRVNGADSADAEEPGSGICV